MGLGTFFKTVKETPFIFPRLLARFSHRSIRGAVKRYLAENPVGRLHLGAGNSTSAGWLGTDLIPLSPDIIRMDVTAPFPIEDQSFDYIYSEHLIEHLTWQENLFVLKECYRILKQGGKIRIATPDLDVLLRLYHNDVSAAGNDYIRWITDTFIENGRIYRPAFVINNAFRNWGHQFLFDKELLEMALNQAGFVNIISCRYNESSDENLRGIELHGRNAGNERMVEFETLILEADRGPA